MHSQMEFSWWEMDFHFDIRWYVSPSLVASQAHRNTSSDWPHIHMSVERAAIDYFPIIGHGGHDTVNNIAEAIPSRVQSSLQSLLVQLPPNSIDENHEAISRILRDAIVETDRALTSDFVRLFPQGGDAISQMSERAIRATLNTGSRCYEDTPLALKRCMQGSTALLALVDPTEKHMWIANLGDCRASE